MVTRRLGRRRAGIVELERMCGRHRKGRRRWCQAYGVGSHRSFGVLATGTNRLRRGRRVRFKSAGIAGIGFTYPIQRIPASTETAGFTSQLARVGEGPGRIWEAGQGEVERMAICFKGKLPWCITGPAAVALGRSNCPWIRVPQLLTGHHRISPRGVCPAPDSRTGIAVRSVRVRRTFCNGRYLRLLGCVVPLSSLGHRQPTRSKAAG